MIDNLILLEIYDVKVKYLIELLIAKGISYSNLKVSEKSITIKTDYKNLAYLKKHFGKKKVKVISYYGMKGISEYLKKEYLFLLSLILGVIIIYILSNIIFNIEIVTSNKKMKEIIREELRSYGIEKYKFIKKYKEIEKIKVHILEDNKDTLEWIEIRRNGTKYIVNLTERVKNEEKEEIPPRNVVAAKDALILKIINKKGTPVKVVNDYVFKGEVIVSGNIMRGEETLVNTVSADATIFGEVWYTVNVTVPYEYVEYVPTGKVINHYYMEFPSFNMTVIGLYNTNNAILEKEVVLDKPFLFFKLIKEKKILYEYKKHEITGKEALEEAVIRAEKSINMTLGEEEYIIDKKVLKNSVFSSKINVEVFFRVYENIVDYSPLINTLESE